MLDEVTYRKHVQSVTDRILERLEEVDPDLVEAEYSQGSLTLRLKDGSRCILSAQPSVRQLWLAVASKGMAHHFNWDDSAHLWMDDKGKGVEVLSFLSEHLSQVAGIKISLS